MPRRGATRDSPVRNASTRSSMPGFALPDEDFRFRSVVESREPWPCFGIWLVGTQAVRAPAGVCRLSRAPWGRLRSSLLSAHHIAGFWRLHCESAEVAASVGRGACSGVLANSTARPARLGRSSS